VGRLRRGAARLTERRTTRGTLATLAALATLALLTACAAPHPLAVLDGLGGPGLADRCLAGLPQPEGTVQHACNDGQGRGHFPIDLEEPGDYVLVVLCDGDVADVTVTFDALTPPAEPAVAACDAGADATQAVIGTLDAPTVTQMVMTQHGHGDTAFFIVRR